MNKTPKETSAKRYQRIGIAWLLSAVLTFITVYAGYRLYLAHKIKVKIGQIRQSGFPVTTAELDQWYAAVPPEQNAALIMTNAFAHLVKVNTNTPNLPIIGRGKLPLRNEPLPPEMRQAIADYVVTNQMALELLEKGLALKSCRYPVDLTPGWDALLPHLVGLKQSAQLLALKALSNIDNGDTDEAAESLLRMLRLADTIAKEPLLVSHLVRMACYQMNYPCLERILCRGSLHDSSLRRFSTLLQSMESSNGFERGVLADRCVGLQSFDYSVAQMTQLLANSGDHNADDFGVAAGFWILRITGRWHLDELYFLSRIDEYLAAVSLPLPDRLEVADEVSNGIQQMKRKKYPYFLSGMFLPGLGKAFDKDATHIALLRTTHAALAVERYRLEHQNQLPETLRDAVQNSPRALSLDPFDRQQLRYKRLGKGYLVYSVGPDGEDNGGAEEKRLSNAQRLAGAGEPSDITFTVER